MAKLDRMGKTRAKRAALERKNSNVGATQMTKIAKTEATRREATNSLFPPFVSKSAWRSNLTAPRLIIVVNGPKETFITSSDAAARPIIAVIRAQRSISRKNEGR
jgi:hypothetical protein